MSLIGIIMSTYNGEKYLREQIDSIMASNLKDFSLFIVDDGSSDSTPDIISEYAHVFPGKVFQLENPVNMGSTLSFLNAVYLLSGTAKDIPLGWDEAVKDASKCQYYMFSDQDDIWLKDKISITYSNMATFEQKHGRSKPLMVFTDAIIVDEKAEFIAPSYHRFQKLAPRMHGFNRILIENKAMGCTSMINRSLARMLRLPADQELSAIRYHDWWLMLMAAGFGKIKYVNSSTMLYRQTGNNQVGGAEYRNQIKNRAADLNGNRNRLEATFKQAELFSSIYANSLSKRKRKILNNFVQLPNMGFFRKRKVFLTNRFYKSGWIRNIGVFFTL